MGILDLFFGAKVSNPALLTVMQTVAQNPSDEHIVDLWQKVLKAKLLLATTPEGKASFKGKAAREAVALPFTVVTGENGESDLAVFTDNASLEAYAPGSPFVVVTGEDAVTIAGGKNYGGMILDPGSDRATNIRCWQHTVFIEKVAEATKLQALASKYTRAGNNADAEGVLKAAIACAQRDPGPQHPFTGELNLELARAMRAQGKLNEAEWVYRRSLSIYEVAGSCDAEVAAVSEALGSLYIENGKGAQAAPLLVRALDIMESLPGAKPDNISRILCQLGELRREEEPNEAEGYYKRATVILEERKHPEALGTLNKAAALMEVNGRPKDAAASYLRVLSLPQTIKRCRDHDLAVASHRLGALELAENKGDVAVEHLEKALELYKRDGGTSEETKAVEALIEQINAATAKVDEEQADSKDSETSHPGLAKSAKPGSRFGGAGKKLSDLPLLDMSQVKNNPKATLAGADSLSKQKEKESATPEDEALEKMKAFLDGVQDQPVAKKDLPKPKVEAPKDEAADAAVEAIISASEKAADEEIRPAAKVESVKAEVRPGAPTLIDEPALRPDEFKLEEPATKAEVKEAPPKPEPAKVVDAPPKPEPPKPAAKPEVKADTGEVKIFDKPVDGEISMVFNSSMLGGPDKDDRFDKPIGERLKEQAKAANPETDTIETTASAKAADPETDTLTVDVATAAKAAEEAKAAQEEKKGGLFDAKVDGEISMFFNKSQLKDVTKDDRFDKPIGERLKEEAAAKAAEAKAEPVVEKKPEPVEEKKPEPVAEKKPEPVAEKDESLFGDDLDDSLGDAFSSLLADPKGAMKDDRFDRPIGERLKEAAASGATPTSSIPSVKAEIPFENPPEPDLGPGTQKASLDELKAAIKAEKEREAREKREAEEAAAAKAAEAAKQEDTGSSLFDDASLDDSLGDAFASLLSDPSKADDRFDKAIAARAAEPEKSPDELLKEGTALVQQQKLDEAIKLFDKVTKLTPNDVKAWYCKGSTLHLKSQFEDALYCFNHVLNLDKDNQKAMLRKAECLSKLGRGDQAIIVYDRLLLLAPKFVAGWLSKARALLQLRKLKEALDCYQMVLALDPANEEANKAKNLISAKLAATR